MVIFVFSAHPSLNCSSVECGRWLSDRLVLIHEMSQPVSFQTPAFAQQYQPLLCCNQKCHQFPQKLCPRDPGLLGIRCSDADHNLSNSGAGSPPLGVSESLPRHGTGFFWPSNRMRNRTATPGMINDNEPSEGPQFHTLSTSALTKHSVLLPIASGECVHA